GGDGPELTRPAAPGDRRRGRLGTGAPQDPADEALSGLVADLVSGSATDAATALASHAISVVAVPPAESAGTGLPQVDRSARSARIATLDAVAGLGRVTESSAGVIWRVSTDQLGPDGDISRIRIEDGDGNYLATVPAQQGHLGGQIGAEGTGRTLVLADRADPGWRAWLG